ncbi:hypothetical protein [Secundilactobacillus folii]|uniref:Uncharacterized protein n=1 Tax=Secundilactobacillus folii TaxID=2678357 RepID=A0A7X2XUE5_9LACO|nr:hypothetical protein [Secundilactobacillus folii]MTV81783.1 hypothetical protein [Secundilactobacillus folii]
MKKWIRTLITLALALAVFAIVPTVASAKNYYSMPRGFRGTWYGNHKIVKVGKKGYTISKYGNYSAFPHFAASRVHHGWWVVGINHTDAASYLKRTTQKVHGHNRVVLDHFMLRIPDKAPYHVEGFARYKSMKNYSIKSTISYLPWY